MSRFGEPTHEVVVEAERVTREAAIRAKLDHARTTAEAVIEAMVVPEPASLTTRERLADCHGLAHLALFFLNRDEVPLFHPTPACADEPTPLYDELAAELQYRDAA